MIAATVQNNAAAAAPPLVSGRYYGPQVNSVLGTLALAQDTMYFVPIYVPSDTLLAGLAVFPTVAVAINAHMGLYTDLNGKPNALIAGTDITVAPLTAAAKNDFTFVAPVFVPKGIYWIAIDVSAACTVTAKASNESSLVGNTTLLAAASGLGVKITASSTYGALPATAPALTYTDTSAMPYLAIKAN